MKCYACGKLVSQFRKIIVNFKSKDCRAIFPGTAQLPMVAPLTPQVRSATNVGKQGIFPGTARRPKRMVRSLSMALSIKCSQRPQRLSPNAIN